MDRRRRWRYRALAGLQVLAAAAIAGAVIYLLYRYVRYGERFARETGAVVREEQAGEEDTEQEDAQTAAEGSDSLPDTVRVRILTDDFAGEYHARIELTCEKSFTVRLDGKRIKKGKAYSVSASELEEGQALQLSCRAEDALFTVQSLTRADGHPQYARTLWLYREPEGIALVNELPLEEYLCGVVSSEMPSDYPEEAQKAQAVCARTYACSCIRRARAGDSIADLDDSVNYQVYNNYRATAQSRQAVEATRGETLPLDEILYYSTSCQSEHRDDLDSDEALRAFLMQEPDAGAEYDSPWLRWETEIPAQDILRELAAGYGLQADRIDEICVTKRAGNGQAQELKLRCGDSEERIEGEYSIRKLLSPAQTTIRLRDGEEHSGMRLLPSAFFWLETVGQQGSGEAQKSGEQKEPDRMQETDGQQEPDGAQESDSVREPESELFAENGENGEHLIDRVVIHGGGYGHGIGMSQCGAAAMAKKGLDYREILGYYYQCELSG